MKKPTSTKKLKTDQMTAEAEMSKYGISRIPMDDQYQLGNYQYTSLKHAVAQAKREQDETTQ